MINVVCVKFGKKYGPEYVNRLYYAVRRNLSIPFRFHCFTEFPQNIHKNVIIHPLRHHRHYEGWWHKLSLFSDDCPIDGRILYLDLDTLITGSLDDIALHNTGFVVLHDFFRIRQPERKDRFGLGKNAVGSGVLSFQSKAHTQIWETFIADPERAVKSLHPHGDQKWIEKHQKQRLYWQDLFPGQVVSFKVHCRSGVPKNARIICYHGRPSIPESINNKTTVQGYTILPTKWILNYWYDEQDTPTNPGGADTSASATAGKNQRKTETEPGATAKDTGGEGKGSRTEGKAASKRQARTKEKARRVAGAQLRVATRRRNRRKVR